MYRDNIILTLLEKTLLINDAIHQNICISELVDKYDNFYYFEALDGHEADETQKSILKELAPYVQLHRDIQNKVFDRLYIGDGLSDKHLKSIGRLALDSALAELIMIGQAHNIDAMLLDLIKLSNVARKRVGS